MYKESELNAELARQGISKKALAQKCQIVEITLLRKCSSGRWYIQEVEKIASALHLTNERMCEIFFA